ncbi:hypothetical protein [Edaphobacillus lindanitolerans]|uniref:Uncharacterized protein n=1 Tax=Edaphobacillus lindanitolerans TaxID=550447 RepID=A0A1U7PST2_9BACI|nr:hypothetical protein [Edaphobacillus lindanitolerans]SIT91555.1 hypothetical protein SAMN05428946_2702 [Edaphobacillus lindanitolerans]
MNQIEKHAEKITNTPKYHADAFTVAGNAWKASGYQDEQQYRMMLKHLEHLQQILGTDQQGVLDFLYRMDIAA